MTNEKLLEKLAKIKAHAESAAAIGSEQEAATFAAMLQAMLIKHKLEMTDLEFVNLDKEEPIEKYRIDYSKYEDIRVRATRVPWIEMLASVVGRAHFVKVLVRRGSSGLSLVGRRSDVEVAEYVIITLQRATEKLAEAEYARFSVECVKQCRNCKQSQSANCLCFEPNWDRCRGFKRSFIAAFIYRLADRYEAERQAQEGGSMALIKSEQALEDFCKDFKQSKQQSNKKRHNNEGRRRGEQAADNVPLHANAVKASKPNGLLED